MLTHFCTGDIVISIGKMNDKFISYPERWRERPYETAATFKLRV